MRTISFFGIMLTLVVAGCSRATAPKIDGTHQRLAVLSGVYLTACQELGHPPKNVEELQPFFSTIAGDLETQCRSERDGRPFVVLWGYDTRGPQEKTWVLAYEEVGKNGKRYAADIMQSVVEVAAKDFAALPFPPGRTPAGKLMWSKDAETGNKGPGIQTKGLTHFRGGAFGNGLFVRVGNAGGSGGRSWAIATPDGEKITSERDDLPGHDTIVFGSGRFLMLTSHSKADLISSQDGATWETVKVADEVTFSWLIWTGNEFIVGDGKAAFRSTDGTAWKKSDMNARGEVKWSDGTRFITSSWPGKASDFISLRHCGVLTDRTQVCIARRL